MPAFVEESNIKWKTNAARIKAGTTERKKLASDVSVIGSMEAINHARLACKTCPLMASQLQRTMGQMTRMHLPEKKIEIIFPRPKPSDDEGEQ